MNGGVRDSRGVTSTAQYISYGVHLGAATPAHSEGEDGRKGRMGCNQGEGHGRDVGRIHVPEARNMVEEVAPGMGHMTRQGCTGRVGGLCPWPVSARGPVGVFAVAAASVPILIVLLVTSPATRMVLIARVYLTLLWLHWTELWPLDFLCR